MAGHSKWANIKHRKAREDAKRGKVFTKLIREITVAAKQGAEPGSNPRLRDAIAKAYAANMTKDTIERAIKRGAGDADDGNLEEITYEGYGPSGVAVMVSCLTDNRNRTVAEVRHAFSKCGGNLGTDGSVAYLFSKRGVFNFEPGSNENQIMEIALEAGAEDVITEQDDSIVVLTDPEQFELVQQALIEASLKPAHSDISMIASTDVTLDEEVGEKMQKMIDMLEDLDDVQDVYHNGVW
jgi:YebC/PmpR family DNA-binding regulatory protein